MTDPGFIYNGAKALFLGGGHSWATDPDLKLILLDSSGGYAPDPDVDYVAGLGAVELDTDNYARQAITSRSVARDDSTNLVRWLASGPVFADLGPGPGGPIVGGAVVIHDTGDDATSETVLWLPEVVGATNGTDFSVSFPVAGLAVFQARTP
jgi:hypothetical protein